EGLLPMTGGSRYGLTSPIFNYPYARTRAALVAAAAGETPDPHMATTLRYANPIDGGWAMPTMAAWMTHVKKGTETVAMRSTDGMVMAVAEGSGTATVGERTFTFGPRDVVAVPGWSWRSFKAAEDCFLFFFSDRGAQEKIGSA